MNVAFVLIVLLVASGGLAVIGLGAVLAHLARPAAGSLMYQPSSNRDYKGSRRLRSVLVLDFLTRLGGGNERILRQVPSGRGRFMQFAIMLVARLALATVLFSYALTVYVHTPAMLTIFIATLCGIFDFSATRFSILALSRSHGLCREIVVASPGILVSFIVAGWYSSRCAPNVSSRRPAGLTWNRAVAVGWNYALAFTKHGRPSECVHPICFLPCGRAPPGCSKNYFRPLGAHGV